MTQRAMRWVAAVATAILLPSIAFAFASGIANAAQSHQSSSSETYSLSFSPNQPKDSAAATFDLKFPTAQPTSITVTLPAGVSLNTAATPQCAAPPTCEPTTELGSGTASVTVNSYVIPLDFTIFNRPGGLALVINIPNGSPVVLLPTWSGSTLTIPLPERYYNGHVIVITNLTLAFNSIGHGGGAFIRTPSTCPKSGWSSLSTFTFASDTAQISSSAKCSRKARKKKKKKKG